ncbi:MAG: helix-turn-helix domain-containing protein [Actinomycetota bacterium]
MTTWLNAKRAAEYATVSEWTIRQAVKRGDLCSYAVGETGRHYRFTEEEIDKWMMSRAYEPPSY